MRKYMPPVWWWSVSAWIFFASGSFGNLYIEHMRDLGGQYLRIYIGMPQDDHRLSLAETEMEVDEVMPSV